MDESSITKIWEKATCVDGFDSDTIRKDCCGAFILKTEFGNRNSKYGWEIDHVYPLSKGGDDNLLNLRPMQWENNIAKGNSFPVYNCAVKASGNDNIHEESQFKVNNALMSKLSKLYHFSKDED